MTFFISFRSNDTHGASVADAQAFETTGLTPDGAKLIPMSDISTAAAGKQVLFSVHGFNVPWRNGLRSAARQENDLLNPAPGATPFPADALYVGVLWPGDWWIPAVNYPWEAHDAVDSGERLAVTIERDFANARTVSFASHSLGARLVLSAAGSSRLAGRVDKVILTAAAADKDCLVTQCAAAHANAQLVFVLSSKRDRVLQIAYPIGDFVSDVFVGDDDGPFTGAMGYRGPRPLVMNYMLPFPINGRPRNPSLTSDYDHGDYYPSAQGAPARGQKSETVSRYIAAAFANGITDWR